MRYSIRRYRKRWGLFLITPDTGEIGILLSTHRTTRAAEIAIIEINVPRSKVRRRWRGIWITPKPITELKTITNAQAFTPPTETEQCQR